MMNSTLGSVVPLAMFYDCYLRDVNIIGVKAFGVLSIFLPPTKQQ